MGSLRLCGAAAIGDGLAFRDLPLTMVALPAAKLFELLLDMEPTQDCVPFPLGYGSFQIFRRALALSPKIHDFDSAEDVRFAMRQPRI